MFRFAFRTSVVTSALILAAMAPSGAQSASPSKTPAPADASIQAVSYTPIAPNARFETQVSDNSELNHETLDLVNRTLAGRGYGVNPEAPLVMVIETNLVRGQKQDDPLGQAYADNDGAKVQARLFSTNQNSLLNPEQSIGSPDRIFRINLAVYDRASGLYVWRGNAMRNNPDLDISKASNEMIAELIGNIGRTVQPQPQPQ